MLRTLASIVAEIESKKTNKAKAEVMKANSSAALKCIVGYAVDPNVKWLLPEGDVPYTPLDKAMDAEGRLYGEYTKLIYLIDSPEGQNVRPFKREQLFLQLLETVDPDDAKLLLRVKDKSLKISPEAVKLAWPNMTAHWE